MIYPYLPGSNSGVFQGISVFVGLIVSLGSTTVIGNIIAGLVITYMRPFKIGDQIKLNDTTGNVIEKTPLVTRIRTPKNAVVTIPNSFMMSSHTVNYSASAREYGLIIHSEVTIGYDASWRLVHELLIDAALNTPGVRRLTSSVCPANFIKRLVSGLSGKCLHQECSGPATNLFHPASEHSGPFQRSWCGDHVASLHGYARRQ